MDIFTHFVLKFPYITIAISFLIGLGFMPMVIDIAKKRDFVVKPNHRTSHVGSIPNIGGIDIFISFLFTVFLFSYDIISQLQFSIIGVFIILIVGFVDDLIEIKAYWKLFGELTAAFFLIVLSDIRLTSLHGFLGIYTMPAAFSYLLSFFVFIVIINALNLIDGVDGLASGLGILYSLFFAVYFLLTGVNAYLSVSAFAMVGSLLVFFLYNVFGRKSKIFMGDSGSLLLGYMLTMYVFEFCEMNAHHRVPQEFYMPAAPAVAVCVLTVPLFDTLRVMATRIKKGTSPFHPDKNHIHHLFLKTGMIHRKVTYILLLFSIFFMAIGLLCRNLKIGVLAGITFATATILTYILWRYVDYKNKNKKTDL